MKSLPTLVFPLLLLPLFLLGDEIKLESLTTTKGETFKSVTVRKVTPANIRIFHSAGAATIPYEELPDDIQKKVGGFNAEEAKKYRDRQRIKQRQNNKALDAIQTGAGASAQKQRGKTDGKTKWVVGKVLRVQDNGVLILPPSERNRTWATPRLSIDPTPEARKRLAREKAQLPAKIKGYLSKGGTFFESVMGQEYMSENWIRSASDYEKVFPLETIFNQYQIMGSLSPFEMISQDQPLVIKTEKAMQVADGDFISLWVTSEQLYKTPDGRTLRSFEIVAEP